MFITLPALNSPVSRTLQLLYVMKGSDIGLLLAYEIQIYQRDYKLLSLLLHESEAETDRELTIDKAITIARQTEAVREQ